jgi:hypothetical protein
VGRAGRAFTTEPFEAYERALEKLAERRDERGAPFPYEPVADCEERAHRMIGAPWPCDERDAFDAVWTATLADLAGKRLEVGRGAFGGWDDGDPRFVRLAWCLARHLRPERVLETGVARGLATRAVLEAFGRNGGGHLWSVDLPPLLEHDLSNETAAAVPARLRDRWTLVQGSSRRILPGLAGGLRPFDLFIHDSMHTTRNVLFELEYVWPALSPGGVVLIDDVEKNAAMAQFTNEHPDAPSMTCTSEDGEVLIGCIVKPADR